MIEKSKWLPAAVMFIASCGGGGERTEESVPPSVGGIWLGFDSNSESVRLYVSESGDVQSSFRIPAVTDGPTFAAGTLGVMDEKSVVGVLQAKGIQPSPTAPRPVELSCSISGSIEERMLLTVQITCSDDDMIVHDENISLAYQPGYEGGSSLESVAGNYTLSFRPETNILNIISDGTLFGMYHNGANCVVNGMISIIDMKYNMLRVEWTMSNCTDPFGIYEGTKMSGLATQTVSGSYSFQLSGQTENGFTVFPVIYHPI